MKKRQLFLPSLKVFFIFTSVFLILAFSVFPLTVFGAFGRDSLSYLYSFQDELSGGLRDDLLDEPQDLQSAWGVIAFASSGFDAKLVYKRNGRSLADFVKNKACSFKIATDIERTILALSATGVDVKVFPGCNLSKKIKNRLDKGTGKIGPSLMSTIFGVLSLRSLGENVPEESVQYIVSAQQSDGGWDSGWGTESNITSQAIMALRASGSPVNNEVYSKAREYLKSLQTDTGGVKYDDNSWSVESDAFSDSFALQAIYAMGEDPEDPYWLKNGRSIEDDLLTLKNPDGSFSFNRSFGVMNPVWTTSIALIGLNGDFLPVKKSNLESYIRENPIPTPTPSPRVSETPLPTPQPSLALSSDNQANSIVPEEVIPPQRQKAGLPKSRIADATLETNGDISPEDAPKTLGAEAERRSGFNYWWFALIGVASFTSGVSARWIEEKIKNAK